MSDRINLTQLRDTAAQHRHSMVVAPTTLLALIDTAEAAIAYRDTIRNHKAEPVSVPEYVRLRATLDRYTTE